MSFLCDGERNGFSGLKQGKLKEEDNVFFLPFLDGACVCRAVS